MVTDAPNFSSHKRLGFCDQWKDSRYVECLPRNLSLYRFCCRPKRCHPYLIFKSTWASPCKLKVKVDTSIILIRNLSAPKLWNCICVDKIFEKVSNWNWNFNRLWEKWYCLCSKNFYDDNRLSFEIKRLQFPVKFYFVMIANKTQGQTLKLVGIVNSDPCFTHGQFYITRSQVNLEYNLYVYAHKKQTI